MNLYLEAFSYANVECIHPAQDRVSGELLCTLNCYFFCKCFVYLSNVRVILLSVTSTQLADVCPLLTKLEGRVSFKTNVP